MPDTCDARVYGKSIHSGDFFSLWHDLPLFEVSPVDSKPTGALNFVCEITKGTRRKFEIATTEPLNPIRSSVEDEAGRLQSFKKGDLYFNWGCFPRYTWGEMLDNVGGEGGVVRSVFAMDRIIRSA